jgi:hypothetical protein
MLQHAVQRHVDAVIILGRQIDGGKVAILEQRHQILEAAQQLAGAVVVALGLDDATLADGPSWLTVPSTGRARVMASSTRGRIPASSRVKKALKLL